MSWLLRVLDLKHKDGEITGHSAFIAELVTTLTSPTSIEKQQIEAIKHIGIVVYIDGKDSSLLVATILPVLLARMKSTNLGHAVLLQILRTLTLLCHRNRQSQGMFLVDQEAYRTLTNLIKGDKGLSASRWACAVLNHLVADNANLLYQWKGDNALMKALKSAADHDTPWTPMPYNVAENLLKVFGVQEGH